MRTPGFLLKPQVMNAILSGECNTSRDVADAAGLTMRQAKACVSRLVEIGAIRRTGRAIDVWSVAGRRTYRLQVFEVVA